MNAEYEAVLERSRQEHYDKQMSTEIDTTEQTNDLQEIPDQQDLVDAETRQEIIAWLKKQRTPLDMVDTRTGRGGQDFHYIRHQYVTETLNRMCGYDWDFSVVREKIHRGQIAVLARLTIRVAGREITKEQWGSSDVKESSGDPLSVGDDFKSATSDALKKCASLLGLGIDMSVPARSEAMQALSEACYEVFGEDNWQAKQRQAIRTLTVSRNDNKLTEVECRALTKFIRSEDTDIPVVREIAKKLK